LATEQAGQRQKCSFLRDLSAPHPPRIAVDVLSMSYPDFYISSILSVNTGANIYFTFSGQSRHSVQNLLTSLSSNDLKIRIHKTVNLPVVLYGCETWFLALREEHRLRVFKNRMLRRYLDGGGMK
jgi:hypothetical protein